MNMTYANALRYSLLGGMFIRRILFCGLLLVLCTSVLAQSQGETQELADVLDKHNGIVLTATQNLLGMASAAPEPEAMRIDFITCTTGPIQVDIQHLVNLSSLHSMMVDSRDQGMLHRLLVIQANGFLRMSERAVRHVNQNLALLRSQAAIAEAQKLRDAIQAIQERIRHTIPKASSP
jgi:hypothetical protein